MTKNFCVLGSTGGSVFKQVWGLDADFRAAIKLVLADRPCGALEFAAQNGIAHVQVAASGGASLSDAILDELVRHRIDFVFVFYTRLLGGAVCERYADRLVNFHPSLLPACPGLHGFEDSVASGALALGCTAHFVDRGTDTGPQIVQSVIKVDPLQRHAPGLRHSVFVHQCAQLLQVFRWLQADRVRRVDGVVRVDGGDYAGPGLHVPALDAPVLAAVGL